MNNFLLADAVDVECDLSSDEVVKTIVHHDAEDRLYVTGYNFPGMYERRVNYGMTGEQLRAVKAPTSYCEQYVKVECFTAAGMVNDYWVNIDDEKVPWTVDDGGQCGCILPSACSFGEKG